jgi:DNA-binding CsgD family transcriptional regulator
VTCLQYVSFSQSTEAFIIREHIADKSQRKFLEYLLEYSQWLIKMVNEMGIGLLISDGKYPYIMNTTLSKLTREDPQNLRKHPIRESIMEEQQESFTKDVQRLANREIKHYQRELPLQTRQEKAVDAEIHGMPLDVNSFSLIVEFVSAREIPGTKQIIAKNEDLNRLIREFHSILHGLGKIVGMQVQSSSDYERTAPHQTKKVRQREKYKLTHREIQVLKYIYEGLTSQQIAEKLYISKRTVESHRANILHKTNSKNTADLIRFAVHHKLL